MRSIFSRMESAASSGVMPVRSASARAAEIAAMRSETRMSVSVHWRCTANGCASTIIPASWTSSSAEGLGSAAASRAPVFSLSLRVVVFKNNSDCATGSGASVPGGHRSFESGSCTGNLCLGGTDGISPEPRKHWGFCSNLCPVGTDASVPGFTSGTDAVVVSGSSSHEFRWLLAECVRRRFSSSSGTCAAAFRSSSSNADFAFNLVGFRSEIMPSATIASFARRTSLFETSDFSSISLKLRRPSGR